MFNSLSNRYLDAFGNKAAWGRGLGGSSPRSDACHCMAALQPTPLQVALHVYIAQVGRYPVDRLICLHGGILRSRPGDWHMLNNFFTMKLHCPPSSTFFFHRRVSLSCTSLFSSRMLSYVLKEAALGKAISSWNMGALGPRKQHWWMQLPLPFLWWL